MSQGNRVTIILQTPNFWGKPLSDYHAIAWDGQTNDFSDLPLCTNNPDACTPTHTACRHLNAFYNGITGQTIQRCTEYADGMVDVR